MSDQEKIIHTKLIDRLLNEKKEREYLVAQAALELDQGIAARTLQETKRFKEQKKLNEQMIIALDKEVATYQDWIKNGVPPKTEVSEDGIATE